MQHVMFEANCNPIFFGSYCHQRPVTFRKCFCSHVALNAVVIFCKMVMGIHVVLVLKGMPHLGMH